MEGLTEVVLGILGGGGVASMMAKYIVNQHTTQIAFLTGELAKAQARAEKAEETVIIAVQALPAIEAHLNRHTENQ